jgi:hypothetical protein
MSELIYKSEEEAYKAAIKEFWKINRELPLGIYVGSKKALTAFDNLGLDSQILINKALIARYKQNIFGDSDSYGRFDPDLINDFSGTTDKEADVDTLHEILSFLNEIIHANYKHFILGEQDRNIYSVHLVPGELV